MNRLIQHRQKYLIGALAIGVLISAIAVNTTPNTVTKSTIATLPSVLGNQTDGSDFSVAVAKHRLGETTETGSQRLILTVRIDNLSRQTIQVAPGIQMYIVTEDGDPIAATAQFLSTDTVIGGPIEPGKTLTQDIDFVLPANAVAKKFVFQADAAAKPMEIGIL